MSSEYVVQIAAGEGRQAWCDRCLTSAAIELGVYALGEDGPSRVGTFRACTRCDPEMFQ